MLKNIFYIIGIITFLLLSLFLLTQFKKDSGILDELRPTIYSSPSPVQSSISGWRTYTNPRQKYQIQYPDEFTVVEDTSISTGPNRFVRNKGVRQDVVTFSLKENQNLIIEINTVNEQDFNSDPDVIRRATLSKINIGGQTTYTDSFMSISERPLPMIKIYYIFYDDKIYSITTIINKYLVQSQDLIEGQNLFDQILSSFKFIDL
jgi:hypothetical protein